MWFASEEQISWLLHGATYVFLRSKHNSALFVLSRCILGYVLYQTAFYMPDAMPNELISCEVGGDTNSHHHMLRLFCSLARGKFYYDILQYSIPLVAGLNGKSAFVFVFAICNTRIAYAWCALIFTFVFSDAGLTSRRFYWHFSFDII